MKKSFWLFSAGIMALAVPAHAQDNSSPQPQQPSGPEQGDVTQAGDDDYGIQEIVVTAQGRQQVLQDVPISVNVVSAESLQNSGATDIRALNQLTPSLLVSSTGTEANGSARIRGIGTVGDNPGLESSVAVFIDGVYRSRTGSGLNELGEVERIEVLRGPQGTLFGRNASAGLINIITKQPNLNESEGYAEATYGNYDFLRVGAGLTGPIGDSGFAYRLDGIYVQRDGFLKDVVNDTSVNDRDRYFVRGQLLWEPNEDIRVRLIGDYTNRDEKCCGAVYLNGQTDPSNGLLTSSQNPIIPVLLQLGTPPEAFTQDPFSRRIYPTPGRTYDGKTEDFGFSGQVDWDLGGMSLTSITAYREYDTEQASDTDYNFADLLFRENDGAAYRRKFETFSQELRLQGSAFDDRLDWLVGGYYSNEDLSLTDNLKFGSQYGAFASCRLLATVSPALPRNPAAAGCLVPPIPGVFPGTAAALAGVFPDPDGPGPIQGAAPFVAGLNLLSTVNLVGSDNDNYRQESENYAFFTHNIIHLTDTLDLTLGARYTNETKKFDASFVNTNTVCPAVQGQLLPFLTPNPATGQRFARTTVPDALIGAVISLACQGNSTAELNGVSISDQRDEDEFTGTAVLSWKPNPSVLVYGSYSRGYKAGGFNLDRSALKSPVTPFSAVGGAQAVVGNLQFDPEIVDAYEIGVKYTSRYVTLNVSAFKQDFENFQLNTFNGSVFLVQNINSCRDDLAGGDLDLSPTTGACGPDRSQPGVTSEGFEVELNLRPARDINFNAGLTYANTRFENDLIGNESGVPLDPALRLLPGNNLSNAPELIVTTAASWTPDIGNTGLSGLVYVDSRVTSDYNTGSDLFPQKEQDSFVVVNARIGVRGPEERWAVELWAQNVFNEDYTQVAFNSPFQSTTNGPASGALANTFSPSQFPGGTQIFSAYLAEPRTYGITVRTRF